MKKIIGVMGPGEKQATKKDLEIAYQVGQIIAESGNTLLCGGMSGVMEESARGAKDKNGLTIGIGSTHNKSDLNKYIDLPLVTGMNSGRNYINIISSDYLIFISINSPGTLSELAFAIKTNKQSIIINGSESLRVYISEFNVNHIHFVNSISELKSMYLEMQL